MYVNSIAFTVSISRSLKFCTAEAPENRREEMLMKSSSKIKALYARRGLNVNWVMADNEFSVLDCQLSSEGVLLNVVARGEHVPEVGRHIRTRKERCRAVYNTLLFKRLPERIVMESVYAMTFWLHAFPTQDRESETSSPKEVVSGITLDANNRCAIPFGSCVQTHEEHDNSMTSHTIGAIALRPTANAEVIHYFSLQTGRLISRNNWTEIPMPADVIQRVEKMAESRALNQLMLGDRRNEALNDDEVAMDVDALSVGSSSSSSDSEPEASYCNEQPDDPDSYDHSDQRKRDDDDHATCGVAHKDDIEGESIKIRPSPPMPKQDLTVAKPKPEITNEVSESGEKDSWLDASGRLYHASTPQLGKRDENEQSENKTAGREHEVGGDNALVDDSAAAKGKNGDDVETAGVHGDNTGTTVVGEKEKVVAAEEQAGRRRQMQTLYECMDRRYGARSGAYGLWPHRKPNYKTKDLMSDDDTETKDSDEVMITQEEQENSPSFGPAELSGHDPFLTPLFNLPPTQHGV